MSKLYFEVVENHSEMFSFRIVNHPFILWHDLEPSRHGKNKINETIFLRKNSKNSIEDIKYEEKEVRNG